MNTEPLPEFREHEPERVQVPAIIRFLLAVVLAVVINLLLPRLCFALFESHVVVADTAYRWLGSILLVAGFVFFTRVLDQVEEDPWTYIGLPRVRSAIHESVVGIAVGAFLITLAVGAVAVAGQLDIHIAVSTRTASRALLIIALLLGGAMLEELMFRGYPFQRLIEAIGVPGAILVLSIFFGAVHLGNPNSGGLRSWGFFNTLAVGILFAVAYLRTRTLWLPFGIHFGWNFFLGVVYGLPVSGIKDFSVVVRATAHGPRILTGGPYGLEASLTGSVVILVGIITLAFLPNSFLKGTARRRGTTPMSI